MGLFSKKEPVPEIPTAPSLPELPTIPRKIEEQKKELPELPSFPLNSKNKNLNQEIVKSAVSDSSERKENDTMIPEVPRFNGEVEMNSDESFSSPKLEFPIPNIPKEEPTTTLTQPSVSMQSSMSADPIFVRIDKFQESQKNFDNIKDMVGEIESVLNKIKDVKAKEESELKGWTDDVEKIKTKLSQIDSDIFSQI